MPRAVSNGGRDDEPAADAGEEALVWDTGLSQFLGRLEEDLIRWHSEERVKAKDRQTKCQRAQKDLATTEALIREAAAMRNLVGSEDESWQEKAKELVLLAKEQRDEVRQMLELIRSHTKLHLEQAGGAALLQKLPSEGQPLASSSEELPKFLKLFLELAEKQPAETVEGRHRRGEGAGKGKDPDKKKRKGMDKKVKKAKLERAGAKTRPMRSADASPDSEWSSSRSPSMSVRRRERRGRHRRYTPSMDSRSFSDSRSPSLSQSRAPVRRTNRCHCRPRGGRGPGGPPFGPRFGGGGGGGGGRRDDAIDIPKEIDRFCHVNKLESRCEKILRDLSPVLARQVMGFSGGTNTFELSGDVRDPTAVVLARVRKAREDRLRGGGMGPPRRRSRGRGKGGGRGGGGGRDDGDRGRSFSSRSRSRSRSPGGRGPPGGRGGGGPPGGRGPHQTTSGSNAIPLGKPREFAAQPEEDKDI